MQTSSISAMIRAHMEETSKGIDSIFENLRRLVIKVRHSLELIQGQVQEMITGKGNPGHKNAIASNPTARVNDLEMMSFNSKKKWMNWKTVPIGTTYASILESENLARLN